MAERGGLPFVQAACVLLSRPSAHTGCGLFLNRLLLSFSIAGLSPRFWQWVDRQSWFSLLCFILFCVFIVILVRNRKCLSQALFERYPFNPEAPLFEITVLGRKSDLSADKKSNKSELLGVQNFPSSVCACVCVCVRTCAY